jgi:hypothetical protein
LSVVERMENKYFIRRILSKPRPRRIADFGFLIADLLIFLTLNSE